MRSTSELDRQFIGTELFEKGSKGLSMRDLKLVTAIALVTGSTCADVAEKYREASSICDEVYIERAK